MLRNDDIDLLQRHAEGELREGEAERVSALLDGSVEARHVAAVFRALGPESPDSVDTGDPAPDGAVHEIMMKVRQVPRHTTTQSGHRQPVRISTWLQSRQQSESQRPSWEESMASRWKIVWGISAAAVVVLAGLWIAGAIPPSTDGADATIGAAKRYQAAQMSSKDVALGDARAQKFLQSETFDRILKDPAARKALSSPEVRKLFAEAAFRDAIDDATFSSNLQKIASDDNLAELFSDEDFVKAIGDQELEAAFGKEDFLQAIGEEPVQAALSDEKVRNFFDSDEFKVAFSNKDFVEAIGKDEIANALGSEEFRNYLANPDLIADLKGGKGKNKYAGLAHDPDMWAAIHDKELAALLDNPEFLAMLGDKLVVAALGNDEFMQMIGDEDLFAAFTDDNMMQLFDDHDVLVALGSDSVELAFSRDDMLTQFTDQMMDAFSGELQQLLGDDDMRAKFLGTQMFDVYMSDSIQMALHDDGFGPALAFSGFEAALGGGGRNEQ